MFAQIDDRLNATLEKIKTFIEAEILPLEPLFLNHDFDALMPELEKRRNRVKKIGLWTPHLPKELGGLGLSLYQFGHVSEAMAYTPLGHYAFNCQAPDVGNTEILLEHATDEQKERFLKPLINGEIRSCFAMTEPEHAGSNPVYMSTSAEKDGDDYVINGHKWFTSAADGANFAIVMAVTNREEQLHKRASQIIVPLDTPGFTLVRNIPVMGETGSGYFSHAEVRFENCRVPQSNLLGKEGEGFLLAQNRLGPGRIHHCMRWVGISERALEMMCRRAATREIKPGTLLGSRQTIQNWIAESHAEISASRLMVLQTADKIDREGSSAARLEISTIKFYVAGVMQRVLDRALQTHGALGMTDDTILAYFYRHERAARIYDGPDEVHKSLVARSLLKKTPNA
ncbi:acyl-CoA dehydrogenase family protein [candidate division KSB1 bacterium]|nr:acyl-CoA dehydrogenase family protein [candidate division KSB1 bacterium]